MHQDIVRTVFCLHHMQSTIRHVRNLSMVRKNNLGQCLVKSMKKIFSEKYICIVSQELQLISGGYLKRIIALKKFPENDRS